MVGPDNITEESNAMKPDRMPDATRTLMYAMLALAGLPACGTDEAIEPAPDGPVVPPDVDGAPAPMPGLTLYDYYIAVDVSPDGRIAVFENFGATEVVAISIDTATGAIRGQAPVGDPSRDLATGVSNTGQIAALHGDPVQAGLTSAAGDWIDLASPYPPCGQDYGGAWDISADAHAVVGLVWNGCHPEAFRWTDATGTGVLSTLQVLGSSQGPNQPTNRASVVSDDGTVVAGFAEYGMTDRSPAMWSADGTGTLLDENNTEIPGEVLSISADGATLAGISGNDGFVWTRGTGMAQIRRFDAALPTDPVYPNAVVAGGAVIFGGVGDAFFSIPTAFVWTAHDGMRALIDVAREGGITIPDGLILESVLGASEDGTVVIGTTLDADFASGTFLLRLPAGAIAP